MDFHRIHPEQPIEELLNCIVWINTGPEDTLNVKCTTIQYSPETHTAPDKAPSNN